ncbi:hypothetical protein HY3_14030 [Hyphomonas pacifica]|uniref:Uncharacterized protein n=1 Tax=Hyphomonas pacifica TaxID=1280941 RepID=A0A062U7P3_9PROT|nr:hypothetical protein HY2_07840 [Hyphomonas pacifica]RAN32847.1 hypothetical protein HY3_14030 [Hyphomonas pacifica]RAN37096.1 hypothetical protein HY11_09925 [Hyphomonas pacifica]
MLAGVAAVACGVTHPRPRTSASPREALHKIVHSPAFTAAIMLIAILLFVYSLWLTRRGVLR